MTNEPDPEPRRREPSEPRDAPRPLELRWLLLALANAFGPGLALWAWTRDDRAAVLLDNVLPEGSTPTQALTWGLGSAALVAGLYLALGLRARRRGDDVGATLRRLSALLAPLAASISLPLMHVPNIEGARRLLIVTLSCTCAASLALSLYTAWPWLRSRARLAALGRSVWAPPITLAMLAIAWSAMMIRLGVIRHRALWSQIWDLGIFDNLMWHAAQGYWQTTSVLRGETFTSAHCAPILQLLAPIYALAPGPETLIVVQILWLASGVIPVYLLSCHVFADWSARRWLGVVFAITWLGHPSLHGVALFDFHALTLAAPMIPWAIYALETDRLRLWIATIAALLLTREDLPFVVAALGLYALASGRRRWAALTVLAAAATLAIVKLVLMQHPDIFMPDAESSYRYANRFTKVIPDPETGGAGDILATVLSNPGFVIQHALTPGKMMFLAALALPTLGLFALAGRGLWALSFGLVFIALGSGGNLQNLYLHYTVFSFPAMVALAVLGLRNLVARVDENRRSAALAGFAIALGCASLLSADRFGALTNSDAFMAGKAPLVRELDDEARERHAWLREQLAQIPPEASVTASNSLGPHVSTRARLYHFRDVPDADWLLVRESEEEYNLLWTLRQRVRMGELERVGRYAKDIALYRRIRAPAAP